MGTGWHFFGTTAADEDQGGFCDTGSHIHYVQGTEEETLNHEAVVIEHGGSSDIRGEGAVYNCTTLEIDGKDAEYPARYEPGK